jgi:C-terminal processing protease CtpA/Prc
MLSRQVRDGENLAYAEWIIDSYFREYYSYVFGHPERFKIAFTKDNHSYAIQTKSLTKDSIFYYRQKNYPLSFPANTSNKGIFLSYPQNQQVGLLTIKDFHSDVLKSEYQQKFRSAIKAIFAELIQNQVPNLVIDLRNNQGGDVENGVFLLKYLLDKPFSVVNAYEKVKNDSLCKARGPSMGFHQPKAQVYKGQIYVLVNGGSFSNSVIVSSCLSRYTNALFVGTESGGNPNVLAGYAKDFELPNTQIKVQVPTIRFTMSSLVHNTGSGIVPNHQVEHRIEDHIQQVDRQLEFLLDLIRRK